MQNKLIIGNYCYCRLLLALGLLLLLPNFTFAQSFDLTNDKKRTFIPFKLVRNMVVIKLHINNRGPYNFILDTGVGVMVITDPKMIDSLGIAYRRTIKIYGLDGQFHEAFVTPPLNIEMPNLTSHGVAAAVLKEDHFALSNYAGMRIHGLLGADFFNTLAVKLNFFDSTLTVSKQKISGCCARALNYPLP